MSLSLALRHSVCVKVFVFVPRLSRMSVRLSGSCFFFRSEMRHLLWFFSCLISLAPTQLATPTGAFQPPVCNLILFHWAILQMLQVVVTGTWSLLTPSANGTCGVQCACTTVCWNCSSMHTWSSPLGYHQATLLVCCRMAGYPHLSSLQQQPTALPVLVLFPCPHPAEREIGWISKILTAPSSRLVFIHFQPLVRLRASFICLPQ